MRGYALAALVVACGGRHAPIRPMPGEALGCDGRDGEIFPGFVIESAVQWTCPQFGEGYAPDRAVCGAEITDVATTCEGVRCTASVRDRMERYPYTWSRRIDVVPEEPGPLRIRHELVHKNGVRDLVMQHCTVEPLPELKLTCSIRDAATGAFVPCTTTIPVGADVHLGMDATFTMDRSDRGNPGLVVLADASRPNDTTQLQCKTEQKANVVSARCMWTATSGSHVAQVRMGGGEGRVFAKLLLVVDGGR